jgi:hypothetical protein
VAVEGRRQWPVVVGVHGRHSRTGCAARL